jgi:RHS repeat-associated protein
MRSKVHRLILIFCVVLLAAIGLAPRALGMVQYGEKLASGIFDEPQELCTCQIEPQSPQLQWFDAEKTPITASGDMRARYYSPYLMRFLNADPIGFSGGSNWFAYAGGDPISKMDPFGLREYGIGLTGTGAAVGGATGGAGVYWSGNPNNHWYDNVGLYGTFGGVIGFEIGASGTFSVYEDGGMRGASTGIDAGLGPVGAALYKSTDPSAVATPFEDAAAILGDLGGSTPYLHRNISGASISGGIGAPVAASVTTNRTGVLTVGDLGRGIGSAFDSAWNSIFGAPVSSVTTPQTRVNSNRPVNSTCNR